MAEDRLFEKARQKAYRLLSLRGRSREELRLKLKERGFEEPVVAKVLSRLSEQRYLDDEVFARDWARRLAVNRHYGNRRIEASLREKGISAGIIREALAEVRRELPEREALRALLEKKLKGKKRRSLDGKEKRRLAQSLMSKGFPAGLILEALENTEEESMDERE